MDAQDHGDRLRDGGGILLAALALGYLAVHVTFITQYGYFRDELYYIACSKHLAWGYVDHPPFSIALLALVRGLIGDSLPALRIVPALAGAAGVWLAGRMARALGAGRSGQALAAIAVAAAPIFLFTTHIYSMNAFDLLFWSLASYLLIRAIEAGATSTWVALGLVLGLGLLNKISVLWLGGGLAVGLVLTPHRRLLLTRRPWLAAAIAGVIFLPYVIWQIRNGWPTVEFMRNATSVKMAPVSPLEFVSSQILVMHPLSAPLWLGGLVFLFFGREGRRWRILGWIYLSVFLLLIVGGKSRASYLAPAYPILFAAGAAGLEALARRWSSRWLMPAYAALLLAGGAALAPLGLPALPVERFVKYSRTLGVGIRQEENASLGALPQHFADMFGWEDLAVEVARIYNALPENDRKRCAIFTENYGEAGAIDFFGSRYGLPPAISHHNNYWLWGPRDYTGAVVIAVGGDPDDEARNFREVVKAGTFECRWCMPYENGRPIWLGRDLVRPLPVMWPEMKVYD
jgi:dolichyl-phosphate-mannose-protein mannosyltransferase